MSLMSWVAFAIFFLPTLSLFLLAYRKSAFIYVFLSGGLLVKLILGRILSGGVGTYFVMDNLRYEWRAHALSTFLINNQPPYFFNHNHRTDFFEKFLAELFYYFGFEPSLGVYFNALTTTLTILLALRIWNSLFWNKERDPSNRGGVILVALLSLYPSLTVWSATNLRESQYLFFIVLGLYGVLRIFEAAKGGVDFASLVWILLGSVGIIFSFVVRSYMGALLLTGGLLALLLTWVTRGLSIKNALISIIILGAGASYLFNALFPNDALAIIDSLSGTRKSFGNIGYQDFARSSFLLDYQLNDVTNLLTFLPLALVHYFFAPFPWNVSSLLQALSLIEVFAVYALIWPTVKGVLVARRENPMLFSILIFALLIAAAQSLFISNMGTIFRHRTIVFILLSFFCSRGLYEIQQKNH